MLPKLQKVSIFRIITRDNLILGNERSTVVISVPPHQSVPFDHNMWSNNMDFSRVWIGVDVSEGTQIWSDKPISTAAKAQVSDLTMSADIPDGTTS